MSDNPFDKVVTESLENINKISKVKSRFKFFLSQATDSINKSIDGSGKITITTQISQTKLNASSLLLTSILSNGSTRDDSKGFIFIEGSLTSELIATWEIFEKTNEISMTVNKIKKIYSADDDGIIDLVSDVLSQKDVMEKAIKLRKNII